MGPRAGLDVLEKTEISFALPGIYPGFLSRPARSVVTMLTELSQHMKGCRFTVENVYAYYLPSVV